MADSGTVFLPLVSSSTLDINGLKQLWGENVLASWLIYKNEHDSFFNPALRYHTGFAYNGYLYDHGTRVENLGVYPMASWFLEGMADYRGSTSEFPEKSLVLVTDAGITILAILEDRLETWMTFLRGNYLGFTSNPNGGWECSYTPRRAAFSKGVLYVIQEPDLGSVTSSAMVNVIDFAMDNIRVESAPTFV